MRLFFKGRAGLWPASLRPRGAPALALAAALVIAGCAPSIPRLPPATDAQVLATIADRHAAIRTIQAQGVLDLAAADGRSITLDAALAARPPDALRLRAWKLGRAVFDATIISGEVWLIPTDNQSPDTPPHDAAAIAQALRMVAESLGPAFYQTADPVIPPPLPRSPRTLVVVGHLAGARARCDIDRPTRTPRRFLSAGGAGLLTCPSPPKGRPQDQGHTPILVTLDAFRLIDTVPWPTRITLTGPPGRISIRLREVELNTDLPPAAFVPPPRAEKAP